MIAYIISTWHSGNCHFNFLYLCTICISALHVYVSSIPEILWNTIHICICLYTCICFGTVLNVCHTICTLHIAHWLLSLSTLVYRSSVSKSFRLRAALRIKPSKGKLKTASMHGCRLSIYIHSHVYGMHSCRLIYTCIYIYIVLTKQVLWLFHQTQFILGDNHFQIKFSKWWLVLPLIHRRGNLFVKWCYSCKHKIHLYG